MSAGWYAVHTHPAAERRAQAHLERQGFEVYLPRYLRQRRHARRVERVSAPLFPTYLFVRLDPAAARWRAINGTIGCRYLVCAGDAPRLLSEAVIAAVRAREDASGHVVLQSSGYAPGQPLRIVGGPFAELTGLFEAVDDRERVVLLLSLLGREVRVRVASLEVEAA